MAPVPDDGRGALLPADLRIRGYHRLVSNAKGYGPWPGMQRAADNPNFDPNYVITI